MTACGGTTKGARTIWSEESADRKVQHAIHVGDVCVFLFPKSDEKVAVCKGLGLYEVVNDASIHDAFDR